jgi:GrpB-like predicted nucleotidyltransferase (UPF0157 family)
LESLEQRIARLVAEEVEIRPYDPGWIRLFEQESAHLRSCLPAELIRRIEHFGSTAVPGLAAKPIVDILVEVTDLERTKTEIVPLLESQGYDYFWRPTIGDDGLPFYAWFIKRDPTGVRTHHIHMVEGGEQFAVHWERLLFRDYLIAHPNVAKEYELLKHRLAAESPRNRATYTQAKTGFIERVMKEIKNAASG